MRQIVVAAISCCVCLLFTCCTGQLERDAYISWVKDYENGLHVRKSVDEFIFDVQFQPLDFIKISNSASAIDDSLQYYTLTVRVNDDHSDILDYKVKSAAEKQQRAYYFSYHFQNDIHLEEEGHQLFPVLFHFEQSISPDNSKTFLLAFENKHASEEVKLVIESPMFGSLPVKMKILKSTPTLRKV